MSDTLAGVSVVELAYHRAAWARAAVPNSPLRLFDFESVADGVYLAQARSQAMINSNSVIFVGTKDVVVVDAHSKPPAAASLIQQLKREITEKPVRYVINTHLRWNHTQEPRLPLVRRKNRLHRRRPLASMGPGTIDGIGRDQGEHPHSGHL
jgi:hypothetical protein